jgi:hypothetical protein
MAGQHAQMNDLRRQSGRRPLALAWWLATMSACGVALGLVFAMRDLAVPDSWGFPGASEAFAMAAGTVGAVVAIRRPDNLNGWLFCAIGALFAIEGLINEYVVASVFATPGGLPLTAGLAWMLTWIWASPIGIALVFLPLFFPTGHLVSPRWRAAVVLGIVAIGLFSLALAFIPGPIQQATFIDNPVGAPMDLETYGRVVLGPSWVPFLIAIILSLGSLVLRFRSSSDDARRQIKWFALAALVGGSVLAVYLTASVVTGSSEATKVLQVLVVLAVLSLPAAAGMAILRYRLYDIDRIVSRTIAYGLLTAALLAVYVGAVLVLQGPLGSITGGDTVSVAISTLIAAGLFSQIRGWVQATVDRRFDRARFDAERTAAAFADRLRGQVDLPMLAADLDATVRTAIAPSRVGLWLRRDAR